MPYEAAQNAATTRLQKRTYCELRPSKYLINVRVRQVIPLLCDTLSLGVPELR